MANEDEAEEQARSRHSDDNDLSTKLAQLDDDRRSWHRRLLDLNSEHYGAARYTYQLQLAEALLHHLPRPKRPELSERAKIGGPGSEKREEHDEPLSAKLARLDEDRRSWHGQLVGICIEANGEASPSYQLKLADLLAKDFPARDLSWSLKELNRKEAESARERDLKLAQQDRLAAIQAANERSTAPETGAAASGQAKGAENPPNAGHTEDRRDGSVPPSNAPPRAPDRSYEPLHRAHEQVAEERQRQTPPPERLQAMLDHYEAVRERERLNAPRQAEIAEREELLAMQKADLRKLEQRHRPPTGSPGGVSPEQQAERRMLDHQHLAEKVGVAARWLAHDLKAEGLPGAEAYGKESRMAFQASRLIHQDRQNWAYDTGLGKNRVRRGLEGQQSRSSAEQQAAQDSNTLTPNQRQHLPPDRQPPAQHSERTSGNGEKPGQKRNGQASKKESGKHRDAGRGGASRGGGKGR